VQRCLRRAVESKFRSFLSRVSSPSVSLSRVWVHLALTNASRFSSTLIVANWQIDLDTELHEGTNRTMKSTRRICRTERNVKNRIRREASRLYVYLSIYFLSTHSKLIESDRVQLNRLEKRTGAAFALFAAESVSFALTSSTASVWLT